MNNKKFLIIIAIIILLVLFVVVLAFLMTHQNKKIVNNNQGNIANQQDVAYALIELKDAEKELTKLRELANDQESLAKIDQLVAKISYYRTEFKKLTKEINKQIVEEFYNSGFWQNIIDLKNKLENN